MSRVHLSLSGDWRECRAVQRACPRAVHLENTTVQQAGQLPQQFMLQLLGDLQEPSERTENSQYWYDANGKLHRDYGLPALINEPKPGRYVKMWYRHGVPYRPHGLPAVERQNRKEWYDRQGELHRVGAPAVLNGEGGAQEWFHHGRRHRVGGPAIIDAMGNTMWYQDGKLHREDGPAIFYVTDGSYAWYIHGEEVPGKNTMGFSVKSKD